MPRAPQTLRLILGDQLNVGHSWFRRPDERVVYALMEVRQETDYAPHHIQKVAAFFAAMRAFAAHLRRAGHRVIYLRLDDPENRQSFRANLEALRRAGGYTRFEYMLPDEHRLEVDLAAAGSALGVPAAAVDSEHFLTARGELAAMFAGRKRYLMESFYRRMRRRFAVLMEGESPAGGRWNFDLQNRGAYDGRVPLPEPLLFDNDVSAIVALLKKSGVRTIGAIDPRRLVWPIDRPQALRLLDDFVARGLPHFGSYQDAMSLASWSLFHSRLSFALNVKLLSPREVIAAAEAAYRADPRRVGIAQAEGFVRQVLGWREYMRGVYWALMPGLAAMNFLGHDRPLPAFYWTGETRMRCLASAIGQSLERAYAHHIQRLMVTGNFALISGVHPDAVEEWYLGIYIDAVQWVEMPNTRAMSQFADGGIVATKPYAASANYLSRMSDYCRACAYDPRRRHGDHACPFNALFWHFYARHRDAFAENPRTAMMVRTFDRMAAAEKRLILKRAERCLQNVDRL